MLFFCQNHAMLRNGKVVVIKEFNGYGAGSTEYYVLRSINGLHYPTHCYCLVFS